MASLYWKRIPLAGSWIGSIVLFLLLLILFLGLIDWNAARGPLGRVASRHLQRQVIFGGPLHVRLLSSTPSVDIQDLTVANPDWAGGGNMIDVHRLRVAIQLSQLFLGHVVLSTLEIDDPQVCLQRDQSGRANWEFGRPAPSKQQPTKAPVIRHFAMRGGRLQLRDAIRKLTFDGKVIAQEQADRAGGGPFGLEGQGTLNQEPFKLTFRGDALLDVELDRPYRFRTQVDAGPSSASISGSIAKPFDLGTMDADIVVQGQNLANLYYLTNLALPLTPPYRLALRVHRAGNHFALNDLAGKIGSSDMHGNASVDLLADGRPKLTATLLSHSLNLGDLGVALGAGVPQQSNTTGAPQVAAPKPEPISPLLLPTFEFQFDRLRSMDAAVDFRADSVQAAKVPFKAVAFNIKVDHGVLSIDPLDFELPLGKLAGQVRLDTTGPMPQATLDVHISDVPLDQFRSKSAAQSPFGGVLQARLQLQGSGNSVHAIAADASGMFSAVVPHGDVRAAFAELTGINVVQALGLLLGKPDQTVPIRCGVAEFQVKDGDARAERVVFDTQKVLITGNGQINFSNEMLDLNIEGQPKAFRIGRLRTPINVRGTLRHPSVGISTPDVLKQGSVAAALGTLLTPVAAVLAFIDPGLAKNADCAALTQQAEDKQVQTTPVGGGSPAAGGTT